MNTKVVRPFGQLVGSLFPGFAARVASVLATRPHRGRAGLQVPDGAEPVTFRFGLRGLRWGQRGPRILALHGWQGHASQFDALACALAAAGFQVIAVDAPAHGRSPGTRAHAIAFADALLEIAPELGEVHAVVGHSMGGGAALYAMAGGLAADRAVIVASPARFGDVLARLAADLGLPAAATRLFYGWMERLTGVPVADLDIAALAREAPPMLLVHDQDDRIIPFDDARRIVARTGASLLATRRLGHRRVLSDPTVVARVLEFLSAPGPVRH